MRVLAYLKLRPYILILTLYALAACAQPGPEDVQVPGVGKLKVQALNEQCADAVMMVVIGRMNAKDALKEYGVALRKLNTYPEQQGYYYTELHPTEIFEGDWPDNQFVLNAKFPCIEAARGFWYSEDYQSIRHLRAGAGHLTVSIHPINEVPEYVNGEKPLRLFEQRPTQTNP